MTEPDESAARPMWQRHWFQVLLACLLGLFVLSFVLPTVWGFIYATRSVLLPLVIALGLAYIVNPLVQWSQRRLRMPRWASVAGVLLVGMMGLSLLGLVIVPPLIAQGTQLFQNAKNVYPGQIAGWLEIDSAQDTSPTPTRPLTEPPPAWWPGTLDWAWSPPLQDGRGPLVTGPVPPVAIARPQVAQAEQQGEPTESQRVVSLAELWESERMQGVFNSGQQYLKNLSWKQIANFLMQSADIGVGVAGAAISFTSYLIVAAVIVVFCFVFFCIHFDSILEWFVPFIPANYRSRTLDIVGKMDHSVSSFVRGRLIQATILAAVLSIGWWIADVPSPLLLGVLAGFLNLIPYAAVVGFIAALILTAIDHVSGGGMLWTLCGTTLVYLLGQGLDGWVVEPTVQGKATNLDPVTILLVVLVGASLAGLLGMLIAIPVAACIKILAREVVLPKLRQIAARN